MGMSWDPGEIVIYNGVLFPLFYRAAFGEVSGAFSQWWSKDNKCCFVRRSPPCLTWWQLTGSQMSEPIMQMWKWTDLSQWPQLVAWNTVVFGGGGGGCGVESGDAVCSLFWWDIPCLSVTSFGGAPFLLKTFGVSPGLWEPLRTCLPHLMPGSLIT